MLLAKRVGTSAKALAAVRRSLACCDARPTLYRARPRLKWAVSSASNCGNFSIRLRNVCAALAGCRSCSWQEPRWW